MIADVMIDRTAPRIGEVNPQEFNECLKLLDINKDDLKIDELGSLSKTGILDNMVFVACCNPFRIKLQENTADIGLVPNEKTSKMSHLVKPIPNRLLAMAWDFGQLTETEERTHVQNQVRA